MSGTVAAALGAVSGVMQALAGPPVTIGGISLSGLAVPATIPFGGKQRLVVHDLPGGGRIIDALGATEDDIAWSATFTGPSAVASARALDTLRQSGKQVALTWPGDQRQCVVKEFHADYGHSGGLIPYKITVTVLPSPQQAPKPTLLGSITSDISNALGLPNLLPAAQQALTAAQAVLPIGAVLTAGSPAFLAVSGAVGTASIAVSAAQTLAGSQLTSIGNAAVAGGQIFGGASGLTAASAAMDALAAATIAAGYVGRAAANLL